MNHLAHLALAPRQPLLRLGNLLGDFVRGHDTAGLPAAVRAGIAQHRAIDRFTDSHPVFRASRNRVAPALSRYSGILIDVFYDHFLLRDWDRLGDGRPIGEFTAEVYAELRAQQSLLPARLRRALPRMVANDWLRACRDLDGVRTVLRRLELRLRRDTELSRGADDLAAHYAAFAADFGAFYPDLAAYAVRLRYLASNSESRWGRRGPSSSQTANCDG